MRCFAPLILAALVAASFVSEGPAARGVASALQPASRLRRPIALAMAGDRLFVANRSGSISIVDVTAGRVVGEMKVGRTLSDLVAAPDGRSLLATDHVAGDLLQLRWDGHGMRIDQRVAVADYPSTVRVSRDGAFCSVASRWSQQLTLVNLGDAMRVRYTADLPFAAREQWLSPDGVNIVVADAFGGGLAVVDVASSAVLAHRSIHAHNIGGLAVAPGASEVLIAHQMLSPNTPTEASRVTWGQIVGNVLRSVRLDELLSGRGAGTDDEAAPIARWSLYPLGGNAAGAGDPGDVEVGNGGVTAVALSGVNEVAIRETTLSPFGRIAVGRRPTALAFSADGRQLFVANTFDDSISIIDVTARRVTATVSLQEPGPQPALTEQERGELLFHDARLALDGWYSCYSCHPDGHTTSQLNDNLSDGTFGTPKRILSLLGVETTQPWSWRGGRASLEEQVQASILSTMHGPHAGARPEHVNAIAAYIRSLPPPPGVDTARRAIDPAAVERGRNVFQSHRCSRCHGPPDYTSQETYDVGLQDERALSHFNPPSLLGVSQRGTYLHDGRARSLREVFEVHRHPNDEPPDVAELTDLITYLRSL